MYKIYRFLFVFMKVVPADDNNSLRSNQALRSNDADYDDSLNYAELQLHSPAAATTDNDTASSNKQRPQQTTIYTEVKPLKMLNKSAPAVNPAGKQTPQPSSSMNQIGVQPSTLTYENVQLQQMASVSNKALLNFRNRNTFGNVIISYISLLIFVIIF